MSTEFERCRRTIGRREITITSWVDVRHQTRSASAPQYVHLLAGTEATSGTSTSRMQAIERVVRALIERLPTPAEPVHHRY